MQNPESRGRVNTSSKPELDILEGIVSRLSELFSTGSKDQIVIKAKVFEQLHHLILMAANLSSNSDCAGRLEKMIALVLEEADDGRKKLITKLSEELSLEDLESDIRWAAALELCNMGQPFAEPILISLLQSYLKDPEGRMKRQKRHYVTAEELAEGPVDTGDSEGPEKEDLLSIRTKKDMGKAKEFGEEELLSFLQGGVSESGSEAEIRIAQSVHALANSVASAKGADKAARVGKALELFLQFIGAENSVTLQKLGLDGVQRIGHQGLPVLMNLLEEGNPEQQAAAAVGLGVVAKDSISVESAEFEKVNPFQRSVSERQTPNSVKLLQDFIEEKLYGMHPASRANLTTSMRVVQPGQSSAKSWLVTYWYHALRLVVDLPSPWTLVASAAAFVLFSSQHPLAELLSHPHTLVRSHRHTQWGFHVQGTGLLHRKIQLRHSWESWVQWFRRSSALKEAPFEQVLSLDEEQRFCAALQAFQLLTRLEVVPKSDLAASTFAAVFARFGLKVHRKDGQLVLVSDGRRPRLLNVEAIERIVHRGFFPERFHATSPVLCVLRPWWLLVDILVVLLQVAICILLMLPPLAWFSIYELARVPYFPMSPVDSLTALHFGPRFAQLSERLLLSSPVLTCTSAIYAAALFMSLVYAYCTEKLPLAPFPILQALTRNERCGEDLMHDQPTCQRRCYVMVAVMHGIPWVAFFLFFAQATGCSALFLCWLGFGVVVEPARFVPLVSALGSFIFAVAARVRGLLTWRRSLAKSIQEIFQASTAVLWVNLMERMKIDVESPSYQRLLQGMASDMDLFELLAQGSSSLWRSQLEKFLAPIIDHQAFEMLVNDIIHAQGNADQDVQLSRSTFGEIMEAVREFLISSMLRKLGFSFASLALRMKYFVFVALILFGFLAVLSQLYPLEANVSTILGGIAPIILGILLQKPGQPRVPADLKHAFEEMLKSLVLGCQAMLVELREQKQNILDWLRELRINDQFVQEMLEVDPFSLLQLAQQTKFQKLLEFLAKRPGRPHGPSEPEQFLEFLAVFEATYSAVKTTSPRFAQMVDQQVHQFLQGHLQALLEPLSSDVALEVQEALRKASESDVDTLEWVGRMIQQLCHPDFQELLTALRERKGCVALKILARFDVDPALAQIHISLQKLALKHVLRLLGSSEQDADRIAAVQDWQQTFALLVQLVVEKLRNEFEPPLSEGMDWKSIEASVEKEFGSIESLVGLSGNMKSIEEFEKKCLDKIAVLLINQNVQNSRVQLSPSGMETIFHLLEVSDIKEILKDPMSFRSESLWEKGNKVAASLAIEHLRLQKSFIEQKMPEQAEWADIERLVEKVAPRELRDAFADPGAGFVDYQGPAAIHWAVLQLKPSLLKLGFQPQSMENLEPMLLQLDVDQLKEGIKKPQTVIRLLEGKGGEVAVNLAIEQAKPSILEQLPSGVRWSDVSDVLIEYCSSSTAALNSLQSPTFSLNSLTDDPHVQKKWQVALARNALEKHLPKGITWKEIEQLVEETDPEELHAALADAAGFQQWCSGQPTTSKETSKEEAHGLHQTISESPSTDPLAVRSQNPVQPTEPVQTREPPQSLSEDSPKAPKLKGKAGRSPARFGRKGVLRPASKANPKEEMQQAGSASSSTDPLGLVRKPIQPIEPIQTPEPPRSLSEDSPKAPKLKGKAGRSPARFGRKGVLRPATKAKPKEEMQQAGSASSSTDPLGLVRKPIQPIEPVQTPEPPHMSLADSHQASSKALKASGSLKKSPTTLWSSDDEHR
ncbi:unnamed protein product [Durusdinium trenchii]|uniref:Uncharacterized protein n=1 Tax=Durusdinium trenchii TaxID=1381693 RepID=A0ABP0I6H9_9DINO